MQAACRARSSTALADELAQELGAATFVREGGDDEPCDYIYVLCMGRTPCVVQVRDHGVAGACRVAGHDAIEELYLRVVVSQRARVAAVQQVAIDLIASDGGWLVRERPRAGVYDAPLLRRMQKLVAILPAYELLHVDFGEIAHAPPGFARGHLARAVRRRAVDRELPVLSAADDDGRDDVRGARMTIEDEVRDALKDLVEEIGAVSARIVDRRRHCAPAFPRARSRSAAASTCASSCRRASSANTGREHDIEAAFERVTRQLRAIRRRYEVARLPEVTVAPGAVADGRQACVERIESYMQGARQHRSRDERVRHQAARS